MWTARPESATKTMVKCRWCGKESVVISQSLGLCAECIKNHFAELHPAVEKVHQEEREGFDLPKEPPKQGKGLRCRICINECSMPEAGRSYCGLRVNIGGKLSGAVGQRGNVFWYHDSLPTNCVADWVCPGGTGAGYPQFAYRHGPEFGYNNLAVFYQACSFDCLFCQNWHYRLSATAAPKVSAQKLADQVDGKTSCICYFGGDPTPQLPYAILTSRLALHQAKDRILRICWETNGSMHPNLLRQMAELSLKSGGCIKFDLKAWSEELHLALCGVSNKRTLENFRLLAQYIERRQKPPLLVASTLLIPGYVEMEEVAKIATFIASLNPGIPYALLAFYPHFFMSDLPTTSRRHAQECLQVAKEAGLNNVRVGNIHLLGSDY
jgi:pyruvate formate lyase activating enzyme